MGQEKTAGSADAVKMGGDGGPGGLISRDEKAALGHGRSVRPAVEQTGDAAGLLRHQAAWRVIPRIHHR